MCPASLAQATAPRGTPRSLRRFVIAVTAVLTFGVMCVAEAAAVASFTFLPTLSVGALAFTAVALAGVAWFPVPARGRPTPVSSTARRRLGVLALTAVGLGLVPVTRLHLGALPFAVCVAALWRGIRTFHDRVVGHRVPWQLPAAAVCGTYVGCWVLSADVLLLVPVGLALARCATLRALLTAPAPRWRPLAVAGTAGAALLVALPLLAASGSDQCLDANRAVAPPTRAADGTVTVALLGDSSTEGIFVPGALTYGAALERRLNDRGGRRFRVVNCGVRGAASRDLDDQLTLALAFHPAVVTAYVGYNDQTDSPDRGLEDRASRLRANLARFVARAHASGVQPMLITPPGGRALEHEWLDRVRSEEIELAATGSVGLVDARSAVRTHAVPALGFVADFVHPNQLGHAWLARDLAARVGAALGQPP